MLSEEELNKRFSHHAPRNENVAADHTDIRHHCLTLADFINTIVPEGREKALAMTKLEEAMMWANAGIARNS